MQRTKRIQLTSNAKVFGAIFLAFVLIPFLFGFLRFEQTRRALIQKEKSMQAQKQELASETKQLTEELERRNTDSYMEYLARKYGFIDPGDKIVDVNEESQASGETETGTKALPGASTAEPAEQSPLLDAE